MGLVGRVAGQEPGAGVERVGRGQYSGTSARGPINRTPKLSTSRKEIQRMRKRAAEAGRHP